MLDRQIARDFIGRDKEIRIFDHWLNNPAAPWILFFHDAFEEANKKGGVGKTWLLRTFAKRIRTKRKAIAVVTIDFFNVAERDGIAIAERIVARLKKTCTSWHPEFFPAFLVEYANAIRERRMDVEDVRERLANALVADLDQLNKSLDDTDTHLLLFFDTFEVIEQNPVIAVLLPSQKFPDNYHFERMRVVIAGRNGPIWTHPNWQERQQEVQVVPLSPFSQEEMVRYINTNAIYSLETPKQVQALYARTEGRPILVGLVTDVLNHRIMTLDELIAVPKADFEPYLVERINNIENPLNWIVLFMAHDFHRFNLNLLDWILNKASLKPVMQEIKHWELEEKLPTLSFVRRSDASPDFVLHDEMQRLVTRYCWPQQDPDLRYRREISHCTISYYEQEISQVQNEQLLHAYTVEMLYHKLFLDVAAGLNYFNEHFNRAISLWLTGFARSLLQEVQKFAEGMSLEQTYNLKLAEAKLLRKEENPAAALALYQKLEGESKSSWLKIHRAELLYEEGYCYQQMSQFAEAKERFTECLKFEESLGNESRRAEILYLLGFIYRREGQLEEAARFYEQSVAIHKKLENQREYANVLNSIANLYRLQGKIEEALRVCKIAWRIRYELWNQGRGSEIALGLSTSTLGIIYLNTDDLVRAERAFQEAFDIFNRNGYRKGIAGMYIRFGQVHMAKGELSQAKQWFETAYQISARVDTEARINSLNKWGWALVLQGKWQDAVPLFEQAVETAEQVHDYYQEAESLIDLADVLERMGKHEQSQDVLRDGEEIAGRFNYNLLLGIAEEFQGDIQYQAHDYQGAFEHFGKSCEYMARYNPVRYSRALRKIVDLLLDTPVNEIPAIITALTAYWKERGLEERFPEMISACQEVHSLMVL